MDGKIYQAIPAVMGEINAVGKNKKNQQQGFMYRGIDDVMNAINPALVNHKVFVVPELLEQTREERQTARGGNLIYSICRIRFRFFAEDGSYVDAVTVGEGMDSGDKATNKAMAIAFKYACFQVFCIPTEEMKDPDGESHEVQQKQPQQPQHAHTDKPGRNPKQEEEEKNRRMVQEASNAVIDATKVKVIREKIARKGVAEKAVLDVYKADCFEVMTTAQWMNAMQQLDKYPDRQG